MRIKKRRSLDVPDGPSADSAERPTWLRKRPTVVLAAEQAASYLGVPVAILEQWAAKGLLTAVPRGAPNSRNCYLRDELVALKVTPPLDMRPDSNLLRKLPQKI